MQNQNVVKYCQHKFEKFAASHQNIHLPLKPSSGALLTVKRKKSRKVMTLAKPQMKVELLMIQELFLLCILSTQFPNTSRK